MKPPNRNGLKTISLAIAWRVVLLAVLLSFCVTTTPAQKHPEGVGEIIEVKVFVRVKVRPREGYLTVYTTTAAQVTLTAEPRFEKTLMADAEGIVIFPRLKPATYKLQIKHDHCQTLEKNDVKIDAGQARALRGELVSNLGTLLLILGKLAAPDVIVRLNDELIPSEQLKISNGRIKLPRKQTDKYRLVVSKPDHEDWSEHIEIKPDPSLDNVLAIPLQRATVALTVKIKPQAYTGKALPPARVFLDGLLRGATKSDGTLPIPGLLPGTYRLKVELEGYDPVERTVPLSPDRREEMAEFELTPLTESGVFSESFDPEIRNWTNPWPAGWYQETGERRGFRIEGTVPAFIYTNKRRANRRFDLYDNLSLIFNVQFLKDKGSAAWVVRAQDEHNYYLFELANKYSKWRARVCNMYVCSPSGCEKVDTRTVLADLEKPEFIRIQFIAEGDTFTVRLLNQPGGQDIGKFNHSQFPNGGIGFRAAEDAGQFVTEVYVDARKKPTGK